MTGALADRIRALSDQDAAYYANLIGAAVVDAPELDDVRERLDQPEELLEAESGEVEAAQSARDALLLLAAADGGAPLVEAALAQPGARAADFGLVSGPVLLTIAYIAITARIKIKIGGVEIEKEGIPGDKQLDLAKTVPTGFTKAVFGG